MYGCMIFTEYSFASKQEVEGWGRPTSIGRLKALFLT
jgi:hypothetical protein